MEIVFTHFANRLFILLAANSGVEVCNADAQLFCSLTDEFTCLRANSMSDFCTVNAILHHQNLKLTNVVDNEFLESIGEHVTSLCV